MKKMTKDQFAKFMAEKLIEIDVHNYDVFYDISRIAEDCKTLDRDKNGEIITNKPIENVYQWFLRPSGSFLICVNNNEWQKECESIRLIFEHKEEYNIVITKNCDYLHNVPFAKITKLI